MKADAALHRELHQERLELAGWHFAFVRPASVLAEWAVIASKGSALHQAFWRPQRSDALSQALQWATMAEGELMASEQRATLPAPPPSEGR